MPRTSDMRERKAAWMGLAMLAVTAACGSSTNEPVEVPLSEFPCQGFSAEGDWQSAPGPPDAVGECVWFLFEDNATFIFEHPLGRVPFSAGGSLISFDEEGTNATIPSGNVFLVVEWDENTATIRNGQNQTFFLRLVLR